MNPLAMLGKLPEAPSARWTLNSVDAQKIVRLGLLALSGIAIRWFATHAEHPFTFGEADLADLQRQAVEALFLPALEALRRLATNGVDAAPAVPPEPQP